MFVTVPLHRLSTDILKTRKKFFLDDSAFAGLKIRIRHPDTTEEFEYPAMVIKRVSEEKLELARISGYYSERFDNETDLIKKKKGYRYSTMYQLDVYEKDVSNLNSWVGKIYDKLRGGDVFATSESLKRTSIPLLDFSSPEDTGSATSLVIQFSFPKDVEGVEISGFDNSIYQYSISLSFWMDYVGEYDAKAISAFNQNVIISN